MSTTTTYAPAFDLDSVPEEDRDRVAAMIPNPAVADAYIHRTVEGMNDFDLFDIALEEIENIILEGPTGSSKTSAFKAYAAARGLPFVVVECNGAMDPGMIIGKTTTLGDGSLGWVDGELPLAIRHGGVVLFDEVNMAIPRIMAAFKMLISVTRQMSVPENAETIKANPVLLIAAAYNNRYQGTSRLNEALLNQFAIPLDWGYERNVEEQLCDSTRLLDFADNARSLATIRTAVSTNMLIEFERHARRMGMRLAMRLFLNHFPDEERGPVARALGAHSAAIADELGVDDIDITVFAEASDDTSE